MSDTASLGEFLRQEREKRGLTLEQVASATKIGIRLLHALEADQFSELPAKPFIRGFVTSYCRFVGLDHKEVLTRFGDFIDQKSQDRPNREAGHSGYAFEKRDGEQSRTILAFVMGGFVVVGGIVFVFLKPSLKHHKGSHADKLRAVHSVASPVPMPSIILPSPSASPSPIASPSPSPSASASAVAIATPSASPSVSPSPAFSPSPVASPSALASPEPSSSASPSPLPSPSPSPSASPDPLNSGLGLKGPELKHKVVFKAVESTWVRYRVDEKPMMQFILKEGKTLVLRAREKIVFQVANPNVVTYSHNGSALKPVYNDEKVVMRQDDTTLFFPVQVAKNTGEPFPGEKPLSGRTPPSKPRTDAEPQD